MYSKSWDSLEVNLFFWIYFQTFASFFIIFEPHIVLSSPALSEVLHSRFSNIYKFF